jgi:hypothetical protein
LVSPETILCRDVGSNLRRLFKGAEEVTSDLFI